jgi:cyclic beta-1,2-glucan synthetase
LGPRHLRNLLFDITGECGYFGKGIYDVGVFESLVNGQIPDSRVLSHDTIEGGLVRTGFCGSTVVGETSPSSLMRLYGRQHRWARGDWQNALLALGGRLKFRPSTYYMLATFVRRSLLPIARTSFIAGAVLRGRACLAPSAMLYWLLSLGPEYCTWCVAAGAAFKRGVSGARIGANIGNVVTLQIREVLLIILAPQQAAVMVDAILRTAYRYSRRRRLLEWDAESYSETVIAAVNVIDIFVIIASLCSCVLGIVAFLRDRSLLCNVVPALWCCGGSYLYWTTRRVVPRFIGSKKDV